MRIALRPRNSGWVLQFAYRRADRGLSRMRDPIAALDDESVQVGPRKVYSDQHAEHQTPTALGPWHSRFAAA